VLLVELDLLELGVLVVHSPHTVDGDLLELLELCQS
jgi:hypothetical protein